MSRAIPKSAILAVLVMSLHVSKQFRAAISLQIDITDIYSVCFNK